MGENRAFTTLTVCWQFFFPRSVCVCVCARITVLLPVTPLLCLRLKQWPCLFVTLTWWPSQNGTVSKQAQVSLARSLSLSFSLLLPLSLSSPHIWQPCPEASPRCQQQNLMALFFFFFFHSDRCTLQANDSAVIYIRTRALPPLAYFHEGSHKQSYYDAAWCLSW